MRHQTVKASSVREASNRIDASFHLSEGIMIRRELKNNPYGVHTFKDVTSKIYCPGIFHRNYVSKGVPFLGGGDILKSDYDSGKYLIEKTTPNHDILAIKRGWTLVTCGGTIGETAFVNSLLAKCWVSQHVMRLVPHNITEGMLYAFCASKYGKLLLTTNTYGSVIPTLNANSIAELPIPVFPSAFQAEVDGLIQDSARLREEAAESLERAVSYFDNLYPVTIDKKKIFSKRINSMTLNGCFAAYNNNIENINFINQYIHDSFKVKDVTTKVFAPPLFKHIYLQKDNGYPFMTGSELTQYNLRYYRWLSPKGMKDINDYVVHEGDLLLYKSGTTDGGILGNVFIADQKLDGCCLSDHVIRMFFKNRKIAYWTFAFLRSKGAKEMLKTLATGAMIPFITPERLKEINIPKPNEKEDWIHNLIEAYINKNSLSKKLEDKAIRMVEEEIEKWNK